MLTYPPDSEPGLLLAGDRKTVGEVVRWISRVLASPNFWAIRRDWNDMVQEVMGRVIDSLRRGRFDADRSLRTYVQGVTRFTAFDAIGRRPPEVQEDEDAEEPAAPTEAGGSVEERLEAAQLTRFVLERAGETCRELLTAYFLDQQSYAEISEATGQPLGTLKSRLFRCLDGARVALAGRGAARGG